MCFKETGLHTQQLTTLGFIVNIIGGCKWSLKTKENLHFDYEYDIHMSSKFKFAKNLALITCFYPKRSGCRTKCARFRPTYLMYSCDSVRAINTVVMDVTWERWRMIMLWVHLWVWWLKWGQWFEMNTWAMNIFPTFHAWSHAVYWRPVWMQPLKCEFHGNTMHYVQYFNYVPTILPLGGQLPYPAKD